MPECNHINDQPEVFIYLENVHGLQVGETYNVGNQPVLIEAIEPEGIWVRKPVFH